MSQHEKKLESNEVSTRLLSRLVAVELTAEEIEQVNGGGQGGTCSNQDCDAQAK